MNPSFSGPSYPTSPAKPASKAIATTDSDLDRLFSGLLAKMNEGSDCAAKTLHDLCTLHPDLWSQLSSLEHNALDSWQRLIAPGTTNRDAFTRGHMNAELARRRKALHVDGDSQIETLLINRILSAWMQVMYADTAYAHYMQRGCTFEASEYH